jgi:mRNA interferase YafQ
MVKPYLTQYSPEFQADMRRLEAKGYDLSRLKAIMDMLVERKDIAEKYSDHQLKRRLRAYRDVHIDDDLDWILVYRIVSHKAIRFERTGSHAEVFGNWHL